MTSHGVIRWETWYVLVRVTHLKHTFAKGFMPRWQREVFKVVGSKYMKERLVYKLQDLKGEDVDGWF